MHLWNTDDKIYTLIDGFKVQARNVCEDIYNLTKMPHDPQQLSRSLSLPLFDS